MYAIAHNTHIQVGENPFTPKEWCNYFVNKNTLDNIGFSLEKIKLEPNKNPRFLSKIDIGHISNTKINNFHNVFMEMLCKDKNLYDNTILPFGTPKNQDGFFAYEYMLNDAYYGNTDNRMPNDNITIAMLMSVLTKVVYILGRTDINYDKAIERHYVDILLSVYHTTKCFYTSKPTIETLISGLVKCTTSRDVTQREIAVIIQNKELDDILFEEIMKLALARSIKYFRKEYGNDKKYTLQDKKYLKGKFGLFFIVPLLKESKQYSQEEVTRFHEKLIECYNVFNNSGIDFTNVDDNWQITREIFKIMNNILIDVIKYKLSHRTNDYYVKLLTTISNTNILKIDEIMYNDITKLIIPIKIPYSGELISCYPSIIKKELKDKEPCYEIISSRITKWASFKLDLKNDEFIGLDWINLINADDHGSLCADIVILNTNTDKLNIITNKVGHCSLISKIVTNDKEKIIFELKDKSCLIHKINNNIEIFTDSGVIVFNCPTIAIAIKNVQLNVYEIKQQ